MSSEDPNRLRNQIKEELEHKRAELAEFQNYMENLKGSGVLVDGGAALRTMTALNEDISRLEMKLSQTIEIVE